MHVGRLLLRISERFLIIGIRSPMRIGRKAIIGAAIAATAAGTMMVAAPKAMAAPSNCTISYPTSGYYQVASVCTSGTGYQEIDVVMSQGAGGEENAVSGNCAAIGQVSEVHVPWPVILYTFVYTSNSSSCS
jgi:hypothetical protein